MPVLEVSYALIKLGAGCSFAQKATAWKHEGVEGQ